MSRAGTFAAAALLLALGVAGWLRWRSEDGTFAKPAEQATAAAPAADGPAEPPEPQIPTLPLESLGDQRDLGTGESEELLARLPTRIDYPLQQKYREQVWSAVPHELVAAHDGLQDHEGEGARRLFIAVVEPGLSDDRVERLVRDIRARHREAEVLRVRVFDSKDAATRPSWTDGGAARKAHLVADLYREPGRERFLVRGREVDP